VEKGAPSQSFILFPEIFYPHCRRHSRPHSGGEDLRAQGASFKRRKGIVLAQGDGLADQHRARSLLEGHSGYFRSGGSGRSVVGDVRRALRMDSKKLWELYGKAAAGKNQLKTELCGLG